MIELLAEDYLQNLVTLCESELFDEDYDEEKSIQIKIPKFTDSSSSYHEITSSFNSSIGKELDDISEESFIGSFHKLPKVPPRTYEEKTEYFYINKNKEKLVKAKKSLKSQKNVLRDCQDIQMRKYMNKSNQYKRGSIFKEEINRMKEKLSQKIHVSTLKKNIDTNNLQERHSLTNLRFKEKRALTPYKSMDNIDFKKFSFSEPSNKVKSKNLYILTQNDIERGYLDLD